MNLATAVAKTKRTLLGLPILVKVTGIAVGMIAFLGLVIGWQIHHAYERLEEQEIQEEASFVAQVLTVGAAPMLRSGKFAEVERLLETMKQVRPAIGTTIEQIELEGGGRRVATRASHGATPGSDVRRFKETARLSAPDPGGLTVVLGDSHIGLEVGWHTRRILVSTAIVAALAVLAGWWLMRLVTHPIRELVQVSRSVKSGQSAARAAVGAKDEVGELAAAFNEMLAVLEQKEALNQQLMRKLVAAEEQQRKNVSRELQNQTGQALTSLIAGLAAVESGGDPQRLAEMRDLASKTLGELHDLSVALRPSALEDLGLVPALQTYCRRVAERFGVMVACSAVGRDEGERPAAEIEVAFYRICLEAIENALRHGQPRQIEVLLKREEGSIIAQIKDDGAGFDASDWRAWCLSGNHAGLLCIEERAALLGGTLQVHSQPGSGTNLVIQIPVRQAVGVS